MKHPLGAGVANVWPWGACWLQDELSANLRGLERLEGFKGWQTAGLDAHKKPWMCGLGVPLAAG